MKLCRACLKELSFLGADFNGKTSTGKLQQREDGKTSTILQKATLFNDSSTAKLQRLFKTSKLLNDSSAISTHELSKIVKTFRWWSSSKMNKINLIFFMINHQETMEFNTKEKKVHRRWKNEYRWEGILY